jgi:hypothetical protein
MTLEFAMTRNIPDEFIEYVEAFDDFYGTPGGPSPTGTSGNDTTVSATATAGPLPTTADAHATMTSEPASPRLSGS